MCKAMGVVFVKDHEGNGMAFVEPSALTDQWNLCLAQPLPTPACAYPGYVGRIFIGALKNGVPFTDSWAGQILSAVAWLQVAMLSGYSWAEAMRAMHKGLHHAYATSLRDVNGTIKAVYSISYRLLGTRAQAAGHVLR